MAHNVLEKGDSFREVGGINSGLHGNWVNVYPKEVCDCSWFCDFVWVTGKAKVLTCSNHGSDVVGTNWGVWWANSEVIIQIV